MRKMTEKQLKKWEQSRDISDEILQGIRDIKGGRIGRRYTTESYPIVRAREKSGLSQAEFAQLLGVSIRTIQDWEQGRREPNAAAKTLIKVAELHPSVLRKIAA
jgi:putative transcriptional regulator